MLFRDFWSRMDAQQRERYADRAGTSVGYITIHLLRRPPTRVPRKDKLERLVEASDGAVSMAEMLSHFYESEHSVA